MAMSPAQPLFCTPHCACARPAAAIASACRACASPAVISTLMALWLLSRKAMVAMSTMASTTGSRMKPRCLYGLCAGCVPRTVSWCTECTLRVISTAAAEWVGCVSRTVSWCTECTLPDDSTAAAGSVGCVSRTAPWCTECTLPDDSTAAAGSVGCVSRTAPWCTECTLPDDSTAAAEWVGCVSRTGPWCTECTLPDDSTAAAEWVGCVSRTVRCMGVVRLTMHPRPAHACSDSPSRPSADLSAPASGQRAGRDRLPAECVPPANA